MIRKTVIITAMAMLLGAGLASAAYQVGDHIDDFTLNDSDGNPVNLYDYAGKVIFINFWGSS